MKIKTVEFIISAVKPGQYPVGSLPEIALVGRSNVGKSSLINKLVQRKNIARTSSTPGKTQTINFYLVNNAWYFVDLPGYGYARVPYATRDNWKVMIETYFSQRGSLKGIWQLVDIRHPPTDKDKEMFQWISHYDFPKLVIATKADKINRSQRGKHLAVVRNELGITADEPVLFSAQTGEGREYLVNWIKAITE
ncbi:MAG: ribosome biogenesis GTP-binding protein YihA/YsxC [Desulfitobacteriaceae bacterium]|nr:ribosome biogenesis GTP-binding protein YihA/YsxC [Desulfitobacteriaceae bacterium]MDD4752785.1 ribosome biogenesis GTP-binding protein YihA/YsxC [Desulfitobacteriaceae bacterium]